MTRFLEVVLGLALMLGGFYCIGAKLGIVGGILAFVLIPVGLGLILGRVISGRKKPQK